MRAVRGLVIHSTVVWPLTSRGRSLIYFQPFHWGDVCIPLLGLDYEWFYRNVSVIIFRQPHNASMVGPLKAHLLRGGGGGRREISVFKQPDSSRNRSPALIKSDFTSDHKYLSAHLWKAGEPWLLRSFATWKCKWKHLGLGAASVIAGIRWPIKRA